MINHTSRRRITKAVAITSVKSPYQVLKYSALVLPVARKSVTESHNLPPNNLINILRVTFFFINDYTLFIPGFVALIPEKIYNYRP